MTSSVGRLTANRTFGAQMEEEWGYRSSPPVHANQEAHFYAYGFSQGANEADGGPPSEDEEETGRSTPNPFTDSTGEGF